jgi:hypothetical protein
MQPLPHCATRASRTTPYWRVGGQGQWRETYSLFLSPVEFSSFNQSLNLRTVCMSPIRQNIAQAKGQPTNAKRYSTICTFSLGLAGTTQANNAITKPEHRAPMPTRRAASLISRSSIRFRLKAPRIDTDHGISGRRKLRKVKTTRNIVRVSRSIIFESVPSYLLGLPG